MSGLPKTDTVIGTLMGFGGGLAYNWAKRRPIFSAAPFLLLCSGLGYAGGSAIYDFKKNQRLEADLMMQDYIRRHPEDFPELERKKYKDVLRPWNVHRT